MNRLARWIASMLIVTVTLTMGCATWDPQTKEKFGTVAGVVVGGTIGALVAGDPRAGLAIGAAAGGLIGNRFGAWLDQRDQDRLAQSTEAAITTGHTQRWENEETGVSAVVHVEEAAPVEETIEIPVLEDQIVELPPIEFIGDAYKAQKTSNIRGGPSTEHRVVGSLAPGTLVHVVGRVQGQNWYLVGQDGAAAGYVHGTLLEEIPPAPPPFASAGALGTQAPAEAAPVAPAKPRGIEMDDVDVAAQGKSEPEAAERPLASFFDALSGNRSTPASGPSASAPAASSPGSAYSADAAAKPAKASFITTSVCRTVTQEVKDKGGNVMSQKVKACRGPNGWEVVGAQQA